MKITLSLGMILFLYQGAIGQQKVSQYPQVEILDITRRGLMFGANPFAESKQQIVKQIGDSLFQAVVKKGQMNAWPKPFGYIPRRDTTGNTVQKERLKRTIMYRIATFNYIFEGKDYGEKSIIMVPFEENHKIDSTFTYDTFYYFMDSRFVKLK